MILEEKYTLSNGVEIPKLGLGTWFKSDKDVVHAVEAYSPIGHGELYKNEEIVEMAEKYNVSVPQLCIRYDQVYAIL
jgi:diketogulonate reductase-like aldo/keto reductase